MGRLGKVDWQRATCLVLEGRVCDKYLEFAIEELARVVFGRYYNYVNSEMREDLLQEARIKAYLLINTGRFHPRLGSLKNFLFTGMRNVMQNYVYSHRKEVPAEDFVVDRLSVMPDMEVNWGVLVINYKIVEDVFGRFGGGYEKYRYPVLLYLAGMGFTFEGVPVTLSREDSELPDTALSSIRDKFCCLIIAHLFDRGRY